MDLPLRGIAVSPGIAIGPALFFGMRQVNVPRYHIEDAAAELDRLNRAIEGARRDLTTLYRETSENLGQAHADIFKAHIMLLDDVVIRDELAAGIKKEKVNVEFLLDRLARKYAEVLESAEEPAFRDRTADLLDVADRLQHHLLDADRPDLKELDEKSVIVAHTLSPSDAATMNLNKTLALCLDTGSMTAHTAILARALEVPAVMGLENIAGKVQPGQTLIVDGGAGLVIIDPSEEKIAQYRAAAEKLRADRAALHAAVKGKSMTADGMAIPAQANVELPLEIPHCKKEFAEGIGLYRTEYMFLNRASLPDEEEQYNSYSEVARAMAPWPVTLRTIDIGGDKFVCHLNISREENPQLGWRAVRFCLERPDIFKTQLRAMLRASVHGNVEIMFPMISGLEELRAVRKLLEEVKEELRDKGMEFKPDVPTGSMIEVPSAVMLTDALARECDFFSIGTNDLIQYSLAVDRVNEKIAHLYEPLHPAVLRMIKMTSDAAAQAGIPCRLCGEMAGDAFYTELLIGLGVTAFSMSAIAIAAIRARIATIDTGRAKALAAEVLALPTATEIRKLLRRRYNQQERDENEPVPLLSETPAGGKAP
jgi:phosphoenolpyruvate-protein phosphotransferase (PTS system enzyme I)